MKKIYQEILKRLDRIEFASIWPEFHLFEFAIYNSQEVCFQDKVIKKDNRFLGNTAISYEGKYLAIYDIESYFSTDDDLDILTADIVHEMFHAFQREKGDLRYPNDLSIAAYAFNPENQGLKYEENKILRKAYEAEDEGEKRNLLNQFIGIRQVREGLIGDLIQNEYNAETIEGMAEYAGYLALQVLSEEKAYKRRQEYLSYITELTKIQFDIRRISYFTGMIFLLTAASLNASIYHDLADNHSSAYSLIASKMKPYKPKVILDERIKSMAEIVQKSKKDKIDEFSKNVKLTIEGDFCIEGYDPMNMIRAGDYMLCTNFVMLKDLKTEIIETLLGTTLLTMKKNSLYEVITYRR